MSAQLHRMRGGKPRSTTAGRLLVAAALVTPLLATACTSSPSPKTTGGLTPVYGTKPINTPTQVTLSLIKDSSGQGPGAGAGVEILFAPKGVAEFLALSETDELSYAGTWSVKSGQMTLSFTESDFTKHATFAISYTGAPVTIPRRTRFLDDRSRVRCA